MLCQKGSVNRLQIVGCFESGMRNAAYRAIRSALDSWIRGFVDSSSVDSRNSLRGLYVRVISVIVIFCGAMTLSVGAQEYTARPGDTVTVTVWERESLSGSATVDINGQVNLPLGTVKVAGLTLDQITQRVTEGLKTYVVEPTVVVAITPASEFTVHVTGAVRSPGAFKVVNGTTLQEAIAQAGGFTDDANEKQIKIVPKPLRQADTVSERIIDLTQFLETADPSHNPILQFGDTVIVAKLPRAERVSTVTVIGAVNRPGAVAVDEPLFLSEIVDLAGGPALNADFENVSILRRNGDEYTHHRLNLEHFLTGADLSANPKVAPGEVVFVPDKSPEAPAFTVNVMGKVQRPGSYRLQDDGRLFNAIYAAEGFAKDAAINQVTIFRPSDEETPRIEVNAAEFLATSDSKYNPQLAVGDTVLVPHQVGVTTEVPSIQTALSGSLRVSTIGEIRKPDTYHVPQETTVLDLLTLAGGPTGLADLQRIWIIRKNQQRIQVDLEKMLDVGEFTSLPALETGDTIFVPQTRKKSSTLKTVFGVFRDISTIAVTILVIERRISD